MTDLEILFIDDEGLIRQTVQLVEGHEGVRTRLRQPEAVTEHELEEADLVLLDLELGDWHTKGELLPLERARDGLGLASVVRSHYRAEEQSGAVALLSDKLRTLAIGVSPPPSEHAIARAHNLEWAFHKNHDRLAERIVELAAASKEARRLWPPEDVQSASQLEHYVGLEETAWASHARRLLTAAQPPIFGLATASQGQAVVRWLAQRVLPHPGVLIDRNQIAAELGLEVDALNDSANAALDALLAPYKYSGALAQFMGPRWWKSGIQAFVTERNGGRPLMDLDASTTLASEIGVPAAMAPPGRVIPLTADLSRFGRPIEREEAVRIRPDDWPVFADPAFIAIADVADADHDEQAALLGMIDPADRAVVASVRPE